MHNFTKQQRQGGVKYASRTLIGNWSEEISLQQSSLQAFIQRKETGTLKLDRHQERMQTALAPVEMTKIRDDPYVHFGDMVQLVQVNTGCVLAVDVEDKDSRPGELACAASASCESCEPVARNTLLLSKYVPSRPTPLEPQWDDDVVRYGQKIRILANPMAQGGPLDASGGEQPLVLYSRPLGVSCAAKLSRHQLVGFTWKAASFDSVWQVQPLDPADCLACEGVEVAAGAPLLLVHCATQTPLNLEEGCRRPAKEYGVELEVSGHAVTSSGKQLALEHAARGETARTLPKRHLSSNHWVFVTGPLLGTLPASQGEAALGLLERSMAALDQQLQDKPGARTALGQKLVRLSGDNGCLRTSELVMALRQVGCEVTEDDGSAIAAELAAQEAAGGAHVRAAAGQVNVSSFLDALDSMAVDRSRS